MKRGLFVLFFAAFVSACSSNGSVTPISTAAQSEQSRKKQDELADGKAQEKNCVEESGKTGSNIKKRRRCVSAGEEGGK